MESSQVELTQIENKLKEINFGRNQLVSDFSKSMSKKIVSFAIVVPVMQRVQNQIQEVQEQTASTKDSIKKIEQEMEKLNVKRLNLEREYYVEKSKLNSKPIKIEKINLGSLTKMETKKVVFNKNIQEISPSSSDSSISFNKFVPYIERPVKPPVDVIKAVRKVAKPIKHVPRLIEFTELQSNLKQIKGTETPKEAKKKQPQLAEIPTKLDIGSEITCLSDVKEIEKLKETKKKQPAPQLAEIPTKIAVGSEIKSLSDLKETEKPKEPKKKQPAPQFTEIPKKLVFDSAINRLSDPEKSTEIVPKTLTPKKIENIKILEDIVIKPADKKLYVVYPSTSTALPDNSSTQPTTNIRIVSKRKDCSPVSLKDLHNIAPVPIEKIKHIKLMPQIKENFRSPDNKTIVLSSEEMSISPPKLMENLLKDVETNSILSLDLDDFENFDNIEDGNLNELENWDMESNFSGGALFCESLVGKETNSSLPFLLYLQLIHQFRTWMLKHQLPMKVIITKSQPKLKILTFLENQPKLKIQTFLEHQPKMKILIFFHFNF